MTQKARIIVRFKPFKTNNYPHFFSIISFYK